MEPMSRMALPRPVRGYGSFYWRIGFSFVVFVVALTVTQSAMFSYLFTRARFTGRSPNNLAAIVAADVGSTLTQDPNVDLGEYLRREYGTLLTTYIVMKDGRIVANRSTTMPDQLRRSVEELLAGTDFRRTGTEPGLPGPPVVMTPVQVNNELRGIVVMPPGPMPNPIMRDVGRVLSLPGMVVLIVATTIAAFFIFAPARRRLKALEHASQKLGAGDLSARAPEGGGDEIARVAAAFNRMAAELAVRDEALRTSDRLRRQMLADVSHELKTPLTAMRGYVETLRMSDVSLDPATRERYFATLERETYRLDRIVKDLLDLARLESGVVRFDARLFAVERVFHHVVQRHEHEATARQVSIQTHVADEADQAFADPDRVEQVVENLVANALRHTPDGGTVELRATVEGDSLVLSVVDSGEGIPAEHVPYVFDRFYKVDTARANGSGSGLGLSIAKAIVDHHGGTIHLTSVPGRTAFTIRLPNLAEHYSTSANL